MLHFGMISVGGEGQCVAARLGGGAMLVIGGIGRGRRCCLRGR